MKYAQVREMREEELNAELVRLERHLYDLRAQAVTEKLADPSQLGKTRRDIARVLTALHSRQASAGTAASAGARKGASAGKAKKRG